MGATCSRAGDHIAEEVSSADIPDPEIYEFLKRSIQETQPGSLPNQHHLLFKQQQLQQRNGKAKSRAKVPSETSVDGSFGEKFSTRLLLRRYSVKAAEEGFSGTHIFAVRSTGSDRTAGAFCQEQCPQEVHTDDPIESLAAQEDRVHQRKHLPPTTLLDEPRHPDPILSINHLFQPSTMSSPPKRKGTFLCSLCMHRLLTYSVQVNDWVVVSEEHSVFVADTRLTADECNHIVAVTEQVCKGQYAAYTYAKQTLGCREFPSLAIAVQDAVHTITHAIMEFSDQRADKARAEGAEDVRKPQLALDDREPHMVKYDVTRRERQKLDMHTDKSEWTFLISLSNGCGMDFTGGGKLSSILSSFDSNILEYQSEPQEHFSNAWIPQCTCNEDMLSYFLESYVTAAREFLLV